MEMRCVPLSVEQSVTMCPTIAAGGPCGGWYQSTERRVDAAYAGHAHEGPGGGYDQYSRRVSETSYMPLGEWASITPAWMLLWLSLGSKGAREVYAADFGTVLERWGPCGGKREHSGLSAAEG